MIKIAIVKSSVYQDLWVTDITKDPFELFKTSMMRCPPIGLTEYFDTDFIIIKESNEFPCQINKNCLSENFKNNMKYSNTNKNPELPFLDETYHCYTSIDSISHNMYDIQWEQYKIVLCINTPISEEILLKYPQILWCYYVGENEDFITNNLISKYDIILNQDVTKNNLPSFSIGFPYSFVGPYTIENMIHKNLLNCETEVVVKNGIFMEINNTQERPVVNIPQPFLKISYECNIPIFIHSQNILENIKRIYHSKYFVKIMGRKLRGNGILEVISAGTLLLVNKNLVIFNDVILDICHVETENDVIEKIKYFEEKEEEYKKYIHLQRKILEEFYNKKPIMNLIEKYEEKQKKQEIELLLYDLFYVESKDTYPPFKNGLYMEEFFLDFMKTNHLKYDKEGRYYIPLLWTNFQIQPWFQEQSNNMQIILDQYIQQHPNEKGYFTVVQMDDGPLLRLPENILVYGACNGNIYLPLIYEDMNHTLINQKRIDFKEKNIFCSFVGRVTHPLRKNLIHFLENNTLFNFSFKTNWSPIVDKENQDEFIMKTIHSKFALAPRGYGRSSFRFFEIFKLGTIPIYVWDDIEWLPYKEIIDYSKICISININEIEKLEDILLNIDEIKYNEMLIEYEKIKHIFELPFMCEYITKG